MTAVTLAALEWAPKVKLWSWALADTEDSKDRVNVRPLSAEGKLFKGAKRALAERTDAPVDSAAWLVSPDDDEVTPCVVLRGTEDGARLRVLTPRGDRESAPEYIRPIPSPGVLPHASGPAVITARTGLARTLVDPRRFAVRWATVWLRGVHHRDGLAGATWIDVARLPHQVAAVRQVLGSPSVRHVLADEVGLGKTVEALMIWSALSARDRSLKCVVAAPRSLVTQWCLEVRRRAERRLRSRRYQDIPPVYEPEAPGSALDADDPRGLMVAEHDALPDLAKRAGPIDMLIVDEAHTLNSDQRKAVESISRSARHLLLLTATPREGKRGSGAAREFRKGFAWAVGLVDPKWPPLDVPEETLERALELTVEESLKRAREHDQIIARGGSNPTRIEGEAVAALAEIPIPSPARIDVRSFLRASTLLERVVRSRRGAIGPGLTATRRLIRVPVEYRGEEVAVLDAVRAMDPAERPAVLKQACSSWDALAGMRGGKTRSLRERLDVIRDARAARRPDAKLEALLDLCARIWDEASASKIVIRCEYAETRDLVFEHLRSLLAAGGLRRSTPGEINEWQREQDGAVGPVARLEQSQDAMLEALRKPDGADRSMLAQLWAFERSDEGGAVALVASDTASVGLNLQFASALIFYDLPWTPGLAEQWIGRLDRLGQRAGEVRVYAMSHRALPTERLLDVYESIGLFDKRGFHVASEIERKINDLLGSTDADEASWEEAVTTVQRLIDEEDEDAAQGEALDLPLEPVSSQEDSLLAVRRFVETMTAAGFTSEARRDGCVKLEWPLSDADVLWLPDASSALRPREVAPGSNPERLAAAREESRALNITGGRLGEGRWLRDWNVDLFSPRHPLFVEVEEHLLADPSLALGGFSCAFARAKAAPGVYLLAQSQTYPALGGAAMTWRCRVPDSALQDEDLSRLWTSVDEALQRMMRVRCRAVLSMDAWLLDPKSDTLRAVPEDRVGELVAALSYAQPKPASAIFPNVEALLVALERSPKAPPPEVMSTATAVAEEVSREAGLRLGRILARRRSSFESIGEGDASRGLRDSRSRALESALEFRWLLEGLPSHARHGAVEAATPRVVAAAVIEVRP